MPFEEATKGNFEKLFREFDKNIASLEVSSYGVMDTSLEEVFLAVTEQAIQAEQGEDFSVSCVTGNCRGDRELPITK